MSISNYSGSNITDYHIQCLPEKFTNQPSSIDNKFLETFGNQKNENKFYCNICNFKCKYKSNYDKHILTEKHKKKCIIVYEGEQEEIQYICCACNKQYINNSGLWKHKKKCLPFDNKKETKKLQNVFTPTDGISQTSIITTDIFFEVLKESKELQQVLIEQNKDLQNKLLEQNNKLLEKDNILIEQNNKIIELASKQSVVTNNNTTNQQFNLQVFLNETCKDAMNIVDFVNSFQLTTDDFETTGKLGFVDGISRIFIKELKKLDTEKLPIHCTDFKRETVYIKDNDVWEKENDEKKKLKWTIDRIAQLNYNQIKQWQEKFPECKENNTPANEHFFGLAKVALGGCGKEEEDKFREKIMRNVLKEVVLDKK